MSGFGRLFKKKTSDEGEKSGQIKHSENVSEEEPGREINGFVEQDTSESVEPARPERSSPEFNDHTFDDDEEMWDDSGSGIVVTSLNPNHEKQSFKSLPTYTKKNSLLKEVGLLFDADSSSADMKTYKTEEAEDVIEELSEEAEFIGAIEQDDEELDFSHIEASNNSDPLTIFEKDPDSISDITLDIEEDPMKAAINNLIAETSEYSKPSRKLEEAQPAKSESSRSTREPQILSTTNRSSQPPVTSSAPAESAPIKFTRDKNVTSPVTETPKSLADKISEALNHLNKECDLIASMVCTADGLVITQGKISPNEKMTTAALAFFRQSREFATQLHLGTPVIAELCDTKYNFMLIHSIPPQPNYAILVTWATHRVDWNIHLPNTIKILMALLKKNNNG